MDEDDYAYSAWGGYPGQDSALLRLDGVFRTLSGTGLRNAMGGASERIRDYASGIADAAGHAVYGTEGGTGTPSCFHSSLDLGQLSMLPNVDDYNLGSNLGRRLRYSGVPMRVGGTSSTPVYEASVSLSDAEGNKREGTVAVKLFSGPLSNLSAASRLSDCDLVRFRVISVDNGGFVFEGPDGGPFTYDKAMFMERLDGDAYALAIRDPSDAAKRSFVSFLGRLLDCLMRHDATFCDMKLENVGFCNREAPVFRLINLDGVNGPLDVSTFPRVAYDPADDMPPRRERSRVLQTLYAFAVAARLFCDPDARLLETFRHGDEATRLAALRSAGPIEANFVGKALEYMADASSS